VITASLIALISLACTVLVSAIAYIQWRENHADRVGSRMDVKIRNLVHEVVKPLEERVGNNSMRLTQSGDRLNRIEDLLRLISTDQRSFADTMAQMGVKVDMYWHTLEALAMNSAKGLHQPDPRRARVDALLEAFMEGTLTPVERIELKKLLVKIRNYEPGAPPLEFPIYPGEQTYAVILLSTMDIVDPRKIAAMGHAAHRSVAHKENEEHA
jgi:hypothetical protein